MTPAQRTDRLPVPPFDEMLHVGRPNIGDRQQFLQIVEEILDRRWLTNGGQVVRELERKLAEHLGVRECIALANGTIALEIAIRALGITGEVIVPAFTFSATVHAPEWLGITPVFADIDPISHTIDPAKIEALITDKTSAIVGVHLWGTPCDTVALDRIAGSHNLMVMYDAAHAFSASHRGKAIGNFGQCEVFSFHATKFFQACEGGAIATNDLELAHKIRLMQNFGFRALDDIVDIGTNGKMSELHAAMGVTNFDCIDEILAVNRRNYHKYRQELEGVDRLRLFEYDETERRNYQYVVLELDEGGPGINRDELIDVLHRHNVRARRYFYPGCHRLPPYQARYPERVNDLPETDRVAARVIVLPTGQNISEGDIERIGGIIRQALR